MAGEWFDAVDHAFSAVMRLEGAEIKVGSLAPKNERPNYDHLNRAARLDSAVVSALATALGIEQNGVCACHQFNADVMRDIRAYVGYLSYQKDEWMRGHEAYTAVLKAAWLCLPPCRPALCSGMSMG